MCTKQKTNVSTFTVYNINISIHLYNNFALNFRMCTGLEAENILLSNINILLTRKQIC